MNKPHYWKFYIIYNPSTWQNYHQQKNRMKSLDLLIRRKICLFLNAKDKLLYMALLSSSWYDLIYSGFAWESLFNHNYDAKWNKHKKTSK